jgi:hypothetical protein
MGFKRFAMPCAAIQALTTNELMSQGHECIVQGLGIPAMEATQWMQQRRFPAAP